MVEGDNEEEPHELFGRRAIDAIVRSLPPVERIYANIRFAILRSKLLSVMDLLLPDRGRILDIGCGFGLFAAYFSQTHRRREILGVDPDARRIAIAQGVASRLQLDRARFSVGDVRTASLGDGFSAAYVLDVMHHIAADEQVSVLRRLRDLLAPGGLLLIKDITTEPYLGLKFTEILDRLMVGWKEPLAYRHHREWGRVLRELGFQVRVERIPDILPYPHIIVAARKG